MKEPQYIKIYQNLLNKIKSGDIEDGSTLETEMELTKIFEVSRVTIRKALEILVNEGYLTRKQGRGTMVTYNNGTPELIDKKIKYNISSSTGKKRLIGYILPDISSSFGMKTLEGIEEEAERRGFYLVMKFTKGDQELEGKAIKDLLALGASGLIIFPQHGEFFNPVIMELSLKKFPYVLIDLELKGLKSSFVGTDNKEASFKAVSHLLDKGHKNILYLSPSVEHTSALEDRLEGTRSAFLSRNVLLPESNILTNFKSTIPGDQTIENVEYDKEILYNVLTKNSDITAIFASEYRLALLASVALNKLNLKIPKDISIICIDSPTDYLGHYDFTHIRQNEYRMGTLAMEKLDEIIQGNSQIQRLVLPVELIEGCTTQSIQ